MVRNRHRSTQFASGDGCTGHKDLWCIIWRIFLSIVYRGRLRVRWRRRQVRNQTAQLLQRASSELVFIQPEHQYIGGLALLETFVGHSQVDGVRIGSLADEL